MFCLASYIKALKPFALNPHATNENFTNAVLKPFIDAGSVVGQNDTYYDLDKTRVSRLLAQKSDVPEKLRNPLRSPNILDRTREEFEYFAKEQLDYAQIDSAAKTIADLLVSDSKMPESAKEKLFAKRDSPVDFLSDALVEAIRADNLITDSSTLWTCGTGSLNYEVGDLLLRGFGKARKQKAIVVIPVNTTFDTKISWDYEQEVTPLVSKMTLHGKWLMRIEDTGASMDELDKRIEKSILLQGIEPVSAHGRGTSPKPEYPLGTIAVIESQHAVFYLLATTRFDENNNAQASINQIKQSIEKLLQFYDLRGQGLDMFLPLIGTGLARIELTHQDSFDLIQQVASENKNRIHGRVTVVIYKGDADKVNLPR